MPPLHVPPAEKDAVSVSQRSRVFFQSIPFPPLCRALLLALSLWPAAHAGLLQWGSRGFVENADSKGRNWDGAYSMTLGVFKGSFVPSFENREQWTDQWMELGTAVYDAEEKRFAGSIDTDAQPTIAAGTKVYFWAKNGEDLTKGPEWVLLTQDTWKWPAASTAITPAVTWTTGEKSISLIVGESGKNGRHLISRALRPVAVSEADWLAKYLGADPKFTDANADPDGDGLPNALEYFLGSDPADASSTKSPAMQTDGPAVRLNLERNPYAESGYTLEASEDLRTWFKVDHELLTDRPDLIETSIPKDPSKSTLFFRFQLKPEAK